MELEKLIEKVEKKAKELADGHYTVMKFTTGYKGFYSSYIDSGFLQRMDNFTDLPALLQDMLNNPSAHIDGGKGKIRCP